eukprot:gene14151-biopygen11302
MSAGAPADPAGPADRRVSGWGSTSPDGDDDGIGSGSGADLIRAPAPPFPSPPCHRRCLAPAVHRHAHLLPADAEQVAEDRLPEVVRRLEQPEPAVPGVVLEPDESRMGLDVIPPASCSPLIPQSKWILSSASRSSAEQAFDTICRRCFRGAPLQNSAAELRGGPPLRSPRANAPPRSSAAELGGAPRSSARLC